MIPLPRIGQTLTQNDRTTAPFYRWLEEASRSLTAGELFDKETAAALAIIATKLGSPDGTVASIPDQPTPTTVDPPIEPYTPPGDNVLDGGSPSDDPARGGSAPLDPVNPGFETGLTAWEEVTPTFTPISSTWAVINDAGQAHGGSKFLRWSGDSSTAGNSMPEGMTYINTTSVDSPGADYLIVNVWARCKRLAAGGVGLTRARIGVKKYNAAGVELSNTINGSLSLFGGSLDSGWVNISTFSRKDDDVAYFRVYVEAQGPAGSTVEFDDLTWNGTAPA